ncbi:MAG: substrate-binding domain-containing protein, partial [Spirochaetales bacterium]|nr:substrate-binding domain-containing protein [Spirochaetales bacterium]
VIRGIDDYCKQKGYNVFIENTDFKPDEERKSLAQLKQMHVDGLIIAASGENNALISQEEQNGFPIVQVHIEYDDLETSIVLSDYKKGAFEATEYLIKMGHRRIAFLTQPYDGARSRYDRYLGYCEAHEKYGIPVDRELIQIWDRARPNSPETLIYCENPPTAFFTMQQDITVELLLALDKAGKEVPRDHSVISFHELPLVELMKVPVTVIRQSPYDIGRESARILLRQIQSDERILERVVLPCTFIERKSCAPPTGKEGTA